MMVVYGGSFDPPHEGHRQSITALLNRWPGAQVLVIPGAQPAGFNNQHKTPTASFADRIAMSKIAFSNVESSTVEILSLEEDMPKPNYTVNTLHHLVSKSTFEKVFLFLGQDQLRNFARWHQPKEILRLANLIVVRRIGSDPETHLQPCLKTDLMDTANELNLSVHWKLNETEAELVELGTQVHLLDIELCCAESSIIRRHIAEGLKIPEGWMNPTVLEYIKHRNIYSRR